MMRRRLLTTAMLLGCGLALGGCVVYDDRYHGGPGYYGRPYYGPGYGYRPPPPPPPRPYAYRRPYWW